MLSLVAALVAAVLAPISMTVMFVVAFASAGLALVGSVISLFAIPHLTRAQTESYQAVAAHGLTRLDVANVLSVPVGN